MSTTQFYVQYAAMRAASSLVDATDRINRFTEHLRDGAIAMYARMGERWYTTQRRDVEARIATGEWR